MPKLTDYEIMMTDAQYWAGYESGVAEATALAQAVEPFVMRIAYLESEYGSNRDANGQWVSDYDIFTVPKREHRCFFALLIAEAVRGNDA